jgi:hypothetical protein
VLTQRRRRLEQQLEHQEREGRALRVALGRLQVGLSGGPLARGCVWWWFDVGGVNILTNLHSHYPTSFSFSISFSPSIIHPYPHPPPSVLTTTLHHPFHQVELQRVDGLIAQHSGLKAVLAEEQTQLQVGRRADALTAAEAMRRRLESADGVLESAAGNAADEDRTSRGSSRTLICLSTPVCPPPTPKKQSNQGRVMRELREMEEETAGLGSSIEEGAANKRQLMAGEGVLAVAFGRLPDWLAMGMITSMEI